MTYKDYMKLPKETLAKELARRDENPIQVFHIPSEKTTPCYAPDGICTNPFHDCINCPKNWSTGGIVTNRF